MKNASVRSAPSKYPAKISLKSKAKNRTKTVKKGEPRYQQRDIRELLRGFKVSVVCQKRSKTHKIENSSPLALSNCLRVYAKIVTSKIEFLRAKSPTPTVKSSKMALK